MPYEAKTWYSPKRKLPPDEEVSSVEGAGDLVFSFSSWAESFHSVSLSLYNSLVRLLSRLAEELS
jgi:hypothetical protein